MLQRVEFVCNSWTVSGGKDDNRNRAFVGCLVSDSLATRNLKVKAFVVFSRLGWYTFLKILMTRRFPITAVQPHRYPAAWCYSEYSCYHHLSFPNTSLWWSHRKLPTSLKLFIASPFFFCIVFTNPKDANIISLLKVEPSWADRSPRITLVMAATSFSFPFPTKDSHHGVGFVGRVTLKSQPAKKKALVAYIPHMSSVNIEFDIAR